MATNHRNLFKGLCLGFRLGFCHFWLSDISVVSCQNNFSYTFIYRSRKLIILVIVLLLFDANIFDSAISKGMRARSSNAMIWCSYPVPDLRGAKGVTAPGIHMQGAPTQVKGRDADSISVKKV